MHLSRRAAPGLFAAILLLIVGDQVSANRTWTSGVASINGGMHYSYFLPDGYDPNQEYPLIVYLHGAGLVGRNNQHIRAREYNDLIARTDTDYPSILLAPQLPTGSWSPSNSVDRTEVLIDRIRSVYSVDDSRIYLTGLSAGGFGVMRYLDEFNAEEAGAFRFAAGAPAAGASINSDAIAPLRDTPIWLAHSGTDNRVSPTTSRNTFLALAGADEIVFSGSAAGGALAESGLTRYTEYANAPHNISDRFFGSTDYYEWLFAQSLTTSVVPEPGAALLLLTGLTGLAGRRRRAELGS